MKLTRPLLSETLPALVAAPASRSRAAFDSLLAAFDAAPAGADRNALAAAIDRAGAQRYAAVSRLYWHTDLDAARADALATAKPILSLRMLGRLDRDLSCANSRFFRTILYPDPAVSALLRDRFVLHWSTERPVPIVTIDFGDGRKIVRTTTGNSVHYVLDAAGRPIDALPGLYAPVAFVAELARSRALHDRIAGLEARERDEALRDHHRKRAAERRQASGTPPAPAPATLREAQLRTMTKRVAEIPDLVRFESIEPALPAPRSEPMKAPAGVPRLPAPSDIDGWTAIGRRLYRIAPRQPILSREARALVTFVIHGTTERLAADAVDRMIGRLEATTVADTALNEFQLRPAIRQMFVDAGGALGFDRLNEMIYRDVFATPASDRWLGLLPRDVYTGLPGDGVVKTM
jgi:hypothetical protein